MTKVEMMKLQLFGLADTYLGEYMEVKDRGWHEEAHTIGTKMGAMWEALARAGIKDEYKEKSGTYKRYTEWRGY